MSTGIDAISSDTLLHATAGLKKLAADPRCREAFLVSPLLQEILAVPAGRYIVAADQAGLRQRLPQLAAKDYRLGVEYVGEEVGDRAEVERIVDEYLTLIDTVDGIGATPVQVGFDLSSVGSLISKKYAVDNTSRLLAAAAAKGITIVISMERSSMVDDILEMFGQLAQEHDNVGLTMQAHLHRTETDLPKVLQYGRKVRLVKGVYREPAAVALPRGPQLNERYLTLLAQAVDEGGTVACATHDSVVLGEARERGLLDGVTELEMLHGVQPALLRNFHASGFPCRISAVYGDNWWLHFLHRLAEYPPMAVVALADIADPDRIVFGSQY